MNYKQNQSNPLSNIEWDTCWMSIRYAMGRRTISSCTLPTHLLQAYYSRWTEAQKHLIIQDLNNYLHDYRKFGDENIDHPIWMKFFYTLDKTKHLFLSLVDGSEIIGFKWNDKYYSLDWWCQGGETYLPEESIKNSLQLHKH